MPLPLLAFVPFVPLMTAVVNTVGGIIQQKSQQDFQRDMVQSQQNFAMLPQDKQNEFARSMHQFQQDSNQGLQSNDHAFKWDLQQNQQQFGLELECLRQGAGLLKTGLEWLKSYHLQKDSQGLQWKLAQENFDRSVKLASLNHENTIKLEKFKQVWESLKQSNEHEFQMRLFEVRKKLELELKQYERDTQILIRFAELKSKIKGAEYLEVLANNPLTLSPIIINQDYERYTKSSKCLLPPQVIISPPALKDEINQQYFSPKLAILEGEITDSLRGFLHEVYPANGKDRPVNFIGGESWKTNKFRAGTPAKILNFLFNHIPTLVLDSVLNRDKISFYMSWWDIESPIITSKLLDIPIPRHLLPDGSEGDVHIQDQEEKIFLATIDFVHQVVSALMIDLYYLSNYNLNPKLPKYLPQLLQVVADQEIKQKIVEMVVICYESVYDQLLENERPDCIPELSLELAISLASLEDKGFAKKLAFRSLSKWLEIRGALPDQRRKDLEAFLTEVDLNYDLDYANQLSKCLFAIGDPQANKFEQVITAWHMKRISGKDTSDRLGRNLYDLG